MSRLPLAAALWLVVSCSSGPRPLPTGPPPEYESPRSYEPDAGSIDTLPGTGPDEAAPTAPPLLPAAPPLLPAPAAPEASPDAGSDPTSDEPPPAPVDAGA